MFVTCIQRYNHIASKEDMFNLMPMHMIKAPYNLSVHLLTFLSLPKNKVKPTNSYCIILHLRVLYYI